MLVIPARRGGVPLLTPSQAREILQPDERFLSIAAVDAADLVPPCTAADISVAEFCGLADFRVVLGLRSSFQGLHQSGPTSDASVSGSTERGRTALTVEQWTAAVRALRPSCAVTLHDSQPLFEPSLRKRRVSLTRTEQWVAQAHERSAAQTLRDAAVAAPVGLVPDLSLRSWSVTSKPLEFVDLASRNESLPDYYQLLRFARECSSDKSLMCVAYTLPQICAALDAGVDFIESPLPWNLAEAGYSLSIAGFCPAPNTPAGQVCLLDLHDDTFKLDIGALNEECECYTCRRHNRAYIHHLLTVQEMNSTILLAIHNLHTLVQLFRCCRHCTEEQRRQYLQQVVASL